MKITITASGLVRGRINESSAFTATANFFSDAFVATAPTNAYYRLDRITQSDPSCNEQVTDWTTLTPATSISIPITSTQNAIGNDYNRSQRMQITVKGDSGLAGQYQSTFKYSIENLAGQN